MNHNIEIYTDVTDKGVLRESAIKKLKRGIPLLKSKHVRIMVEVVKNTRSLRQNRYLHLTFTILTESLNDLGNEFTMPEVKELLKFKFATIDVFDKLSGEVIGQRVQKTSEMTTVELSLFIDNIIRWASDFQIVLLYPNENFELDFDRKPN